MTPLDKIRDSHRLSSGSIRDVLTHHGFRVRRQAVECPNPDHHDHSLDNARIYTSRGKERVKCFSCGFNEDVIGVIQALSPEPVTDRTVGNLCTYKKVSQENLVTTASMVSNTGLKDQSLVEWVKGAPEASRAGWLQVVEEWPSLVLIVNDRVLRLRRLAELDFDSILLGAASAAVKVHGRNKNRWIDGGGKKLVYFALEHIRRAIRLEVADQLKGDVVVGIGVVEVPLDDIDVSEQVDDAFPLDANDFVGVCAECHGPIPASRSDAKYCKRSCQQQAYRKRQDSEPQTVAQAIADFYETRLTEDTKDKLLFVAVEYVSKQDSYISYLHEKILNGPNRPAYKDLVQQLKDSKFKETKGLKRSLWEEGRRGPIVVRKYREEVN